MSEMVERVAAVIAMEIAELNATQCKAMKFPDDFNGDTIDRATCTARAAINAMRDLADNPGPNYTQGEYSRRNVEAMADDALGRTAV